MQGLTLRMCAIGLACLLATCVVEAAKPVDSDGDGMLTPFK